MNVLSFSYYLVFLIWTRVISVHFLYLTMFPFSCFRMGQSSMTHQVFFVTDIESVVRFSKFQMGCQNSRPYIKKVFYFQDTGSAIWDFENLTSNLVIIKPKIPRVYNYKLCQPYWLSYFECRKYDFRLHFSNKKNLRVSNFLSALKHIGWWVTEIDPYGNRGEDFLWYPKNG